MCYRIIVVFKLPSAGDDNFEIIYDMAIGTSQILTSMEKD